MVLLIISTVYTPTDVVPTPIVTNNVKDVVEQVFLKKKHKHGWWRIMNTGHEALPLHYIEPSTEDYTYLTLLYY